MALIKCEECGHMMSDAAKKCPKCGCPTSVHYIEIHYEGNPTFIVKGTVKLKVNGEEINHGGDFKNGLSAKVLLKTSPIIVELSSCHNLRKVKFTIDVDPMKNSQLELKYNTGIGFFASAEYVVEGEEAIVIKASKGDKRKYYLFCFIILIVGIAAYLYEYNLSRSNREEANKQLDELIHKQTVDAENENVPLSDEFDDASSFPELTEEDIRDCFWAHWEQYKDDREFVSSEGCSEGYQIFMSDLNGDGTSDAVVNVCVTASTAEIDNGNTDNKSFIFFFVNKGGRCEFVSATRLNAMFLIDGVNNGKISAHSFGYAPRRGGGARVSVKDVRTFQYKEGKLVDLGGEKQVVGGDEYAELGLNLEKKGLLDGFSCGYEGDMGGFPIKMNLAVFSDNIVNGEYQNIKYGTTLSLVGQLKADKTLSLASEDKREKVLFELSLSSQGGLVGNAVVGEKTLTVKLKQVSIEVVDDSH